MSKPGKCIVTEYSTCLSWAQVTGHSVGFSKIYFTVSRWLTRRTVGGGLVLARGLYRDTVHHGWEGMAACPVSEWGSWWHVSTVRSNQDLPPCDPLPAVKLHILGFHNLLKKCHLLSIRAQTHDAVRDTTSNYCRCAEQGCMEGTELWLR